MGEGKTWTSSVQMGYKFASHQSLQCLWRRTRIGWHREGLDGCVQNSGCVRGAWEERTAGVESDSERKKGKLVQADFELWTIEC